jgi:hypothetical protein
MSDTITKLSEILMNAADTYQGYRITVGSHDDWARWNRSPSPTGRPTGSNTPTDSPATFVSHIDEQFCEVPTW